MVYIQLIYIYVVVMMAWIWIYGQAPSIQEIVQRYSMGGILFTKIYQF